MIRPPLDPWERGDETAAYDRSMALGAALGMRPPYPLASSDPGPTCPHGRRCRRCALHQGEWVDFG